jgi:YjbE family integral membrane protein
MDWMSSEVWIALWQIVVVDVLLSGDNAVVIALACRNLPDKQRNVAVLAGTAGAVLARLVFCFTISTLLEITALKLIGGVLLLWIGIKLMQPEEHDEGENIKSAAGLWGAIQTIVIADLVMSLDNVIGIVAAAKGHFGLIAFGLCLSIPLIIFGSKIVLRILSRFPMLVIAGAGLLGWLAGEIMVHDPLVPRFVLHHESSHAETLVACMTGATIVVVLGTFMKRRALARFAERRSRMVPPPPAVETEPS